MVSCCGNARVDDPEHSNGVRLPLNAAGPVAVQPVAQRGLQLPEKTIYPSTSPISQAHTPNLPHSPPPPSFVTAGTYASASRQSPLQPDTSYGSADLPRPELVVPSWRSNMQTTYVTHTRPKDDGPPAVPMDEGKMSISIDFGAWTCIC
jgi:hypothetical protein